MCGPNQEDVPLAKPREHLQPFGSPVLDAYLDFDPFGFPVPHTGDPGIGVAALDRARGDDQCLSPLGGDPPLGKEPGHQFPIRVWKCHENGHLPRNRVGRGTDPLDAAGEVLCAADPLISKSTGVPIRRLGNSSEGTVASSSSREGSMILNSSAPGATMSPALAGRAATTPLIGENTVVFDSCCLAETNRALASASCAWAAETELRATSRSRSARAPACTSLPVRLSSRSATCTAFSAERTADSADVTISRSDPSSIRARSVPRFTALSDLAMNLEDRAADLGPDGRLPIGLQGSGNDRTGEDLFGLNLHHVLTSDQHGLLFWRSGLHRGLSGPTGLQKTAREDQNEQYQEISLSHYLLNPV